MPGLLNRVASMVERFAPSGSLAQAHASEWVAKDLYKMSSDVRMHMLDIGPMEHLKNLMFVHAGVGTAAARAMNLRKKPGYSTNLNFGKDWGAITSPSATEADIPLRDTRAFYNLRRAANKFTNLKLPKPPPPGRGGASLDDIISRNSSTPPAPRSAPPINKVASTNSPIGPSASLGGGAATGIVGGGLTANFFSSEENRGFGTFVKGAAFGLGGGLGMHVAMGSKIMSGTTGAIARAAKKGGNETAISWAGGAHRAAVMAQSQQSRAAAWSAGALLAGGMGGSGKSKAHGMNANRGNRFGG